MLIRPAASSLPIDEAMKNVTEVHSVAELKEFIAKNYEGVFNIDTLQCQYYCEDERINWHTYLITADFADGTYKQQAVVYANEPMENLPDRIIKGPLFDKDPKHRYIIVKEKDGSNYYLDNNIKWKDGTVQKIEDCKVFECPRSEIWEKVAWAKCLVTDPNEKPAIYPVEVVATSNGSDIFLRPLD